MTINSKVSRKRKKLVRKFSNLDNQGLISSSWNKLMNYVKLGKDNKYKVFSEEINEKKQEFMSLYQAVK